MTVDNVEDAVVSVTVAMVRLESCTPGAFVADISLANIITSSPARG